MGTTLLGIPLMLAFLKVPYWNLFYLYYLILTSCFLVNIIGLVFEALKLTHQSDAQVLRLFKSEFRDSAVSFWSSTIQ
jgi:hypothetical protein